MRGEVAIDRALARAAKAAALAGLAFLAAGCGGDDTFPVNPCETGGLRLVAFASDRDGQYDVFLYDLLAGGFRLLHDLNSPTLADSSPALSSDRLFVAFVSERGATGTDILFYSRSNCTLGTIPGLVSAGDEAHPNFSYDTRRLAFDRDTLGHRRIRAVDGNAFQMVSLPALQDPQAWDDVEPSQDLSGDWVVFASNRNGNWDLFYYDRTLDSVKTFPNLNTGASEIEPSITPDRKYLAFASDRAGGRGGFDVYLYSIEGGGVVLTDSLNSAADERRPSIGRTGERIAFHSDRDSSGNSNVYLYNRFTNVVSTASGLSNAARDVQPALVDP